MNNKTKFKIGLISLGVLLGLCLGTTLMDEYFDWSDYWPHQHPLFKLYEGMVDAGQSVKGLATQLWTKAPVNHEALNWLGFEEDDGSGGPEGALVGGTGSDMDKPVKGAAAFYGQWVAPAVDQSKEAYNFLMDSFLPSGEEKKRQDAVDHRIADLKGKIESMKQAKKDLDDGINMLNQEVGTLNANKTPFNQATEPVRQMVQQFPGNIFSGGGGNTSTMPLIGSRSVDTPGSTGGNNTYNNTYNTFPPATPPGSGGGGGSGDPPKTPCVCP